MQKAIDDPAWSVHGPRNNPAAEDNIAALLKAWRGKSWPIFHIRHDSTFPTSPYRPGQIGNGFKDEVSPLTSEIVIPKQTNSAFIGTDLQSRLHAENIDTLYMVGVMTNNSLEATVRMAGNLGFKTFLVEDAAFTFARLDYDGNLWSAEQIHALSLANMDEEYCMIIKTHDALKVVHPS